MRGPRHLHTGVTCGCSLPHPLGTLECFFRGRDRSIGVSLTAVASNSAGTWGQAIDHIHGDLAMAPGFPGCPWRVGKALGGGEGQSNGTPFCVVHWAGLHSLRQVGPNFPATTSNPSWDRSLCLYPLVLHWDCRSACGGNAHFLHWISEQHQLQRSSHERIEAPGNSFPVPKKTSTQLTFDLESMSSGSQTTFLPKTVFCQVS